MSESGERRVWILGTMGTSNLRVHEPMNRYETSIPRFACGAVALAMMALTVAVTVVVPAKMDADQHEPGMLATSKATTATSNGSAGDSADIVALREQGLPAIPCTSYIAARKPNG